MESNFSGPARSIFDFSSKPSDSCEGAIENIDLANFRLRRRIESYRKRQNDCMPRYDQSFSGLCEQNLQDTLHLKQRFLDTKTKRVPKTKEKKQDGIQSSVHVVSYIFYLIVVLGAHPVDFNAFVLSGIRINSATWVLETNKSPSGFDRNIH